MPPHPFLVCSKIEPTKAMNIECIMVLDRPIDRSAFRAVLLERGLSIHRMRSRIVMGRGGRHFFEELDPTAIVDCILHETSLPDGTWADLQALLSRELLKPWREDLPHWEVHIVRGLRRSSDLAGDTVLFFRLDHALGDGFALKNWLMSLTDELNPNSMSSQRTESTDHLPQLLPQRGPPANNAKRPSVAKSAMAGAMARSLAVWAVLRTVFLQVLLMLPALWVAVVESELDDTMTHIKWDDSRHTKSMKKEIRVSGEYTLDSIRALAKSMSTPSKRCTINDVLMGIVAGGLRGYLEKVKDPVVAAAVEGGGGGRCRLRAIMVTSLREKINSTKVEFANCLTFLPILLPVDEPVLEGRIRKIKSYIDFLKMSPAPWLILRLQEVCTNLYVFLRVFVRARTYVHTHVHVKATLNFSSQEYFPTHPPPPCPKNTHTHTHRIHTQLLVFLLGPAALQWKINRTQRKQTLCISNLPGPLAPVTVCGAKISRIGFWVNPSNMPMMCSGICTYTHTYREREKVGTKGPRAYR